VTLLNFRRSDFEDSFRDTRKTLSKLNLEWQERIQRIMGHKRKRIEDKIGKNTEVKAHLRRRSEVLQKLFVNSLETEKKLVNSKTIHIENPKQPIKEFVNVWKEYDDKKKSYSALEDFHNTLKLWGHILNFKVEDANLSPEKYRAHDSTKSSLDGWLSADIIVKQANVPKNKVWDILKKALCEERGALETQEFHYPDQNNIDRSFPIFRLRQDSSNYLLLWLYFSIRGKAQEFFESDFGSLIRTPYGGISKVLGSLQDDPEHVFQLISCELGGYPNKFEEIWEATSSKKQEEKEGFTPIGSNARARI